MSAVPDVQAEVGGQLAGLTCLREPRFEVFGLELWLDGVLLDSPGDAGKGEGESSEALDGVEHCLSYPDF